MKKRNFHLPLLVMLASCFGSTHIVQYDNVVADVPEFSQKITIATWDQRIQVLDRSRKPDYVGWLQAGNGIAYRLGTHSRKPLADDISASISRSLQNKGSSVTVVTTTHNETESLIIENLKKENTDRKILIKCKQFDTGGSGRQSLDFNVHITVWSSNGSILKQKNFGGSYELGGNNVLGVGSYKKYMPEGLRLLMEEIFNDKEIVLTLKRQ